MAKATSAALLMLTLAATGAAAQMENLEGTGFVPLDEAEEIVLARSAAPAEVSANATIWAIRDGRYTIVVEGNANHCFVARTYPKSMEPVCYDPEAAKTILPIEIRRFELRHLLRAQHR